MMTPHYMPSDVPSWFMSKVKLKVTEQAVRSGDHMCLIMQIQVSTELDTYKVDVIRHPLTAIHNLVRQAYADMETQCIDSTALLA